MEKFISDNLSSLIQIYIKERHSKNNELGFLYINKNIDENKIDVNFFEISNPVLSDEVRNDIIEKNNVRNSLMFIVAENKIIVIDLEKK